jgi:hypothetical protein
MVFHMRLFCALLLAIFLTVACSSPLRAQGPMQIEAIAGQPFGVGKIVLDVPEDMLPQPLASEGIGLSERNGRIFYPTIDNPVAGKFVRELLGANTPLTTGGPVREEVGGLLRGIFDRPPRTTLYFLFRGAEPLQVTLQLRKPIELAIVPTAGVAPPEVGRRIRRNLPATHRSLLESWWRQYARVPGLLQPKPDYPPMIDDYLTATLARRLDLPLPKPKQRPSGHSDLGKEIGFNLGTESIRMAMLQDRILGLNNLDETADQPLPEPFAQPELQTPEPPADVKVEPIAMRVPVECFYVRFGSFANFLWLQDTLAKWGGDAQNLIALRGLDRGMSRHIEKELVLKQTVLSRMLGDTVIADVAIIGTDTFFREGACYGILFHARNNLGLSSSLMQQRQERIKAGGVTEKKVKIDGQSVSYLTSPDGAVRSYYVTSGDFHFVTTSKALAARFLATASGTDSLGKSREFRHARSVMPIGRGDTIWLYASDAFFRNITSPGYRVEMARRLQAAADIDLVQLARLAAAGEGKPGDTIEQLKSASVLPPEFGPLPDGSRVVLNGADVYDSHRGWRGAFMPILDMPVAGVTRAEVSDYNKFVDYYRTNWGRMDPVIAGVKRTALAGNRERVVVDVLMSPFAPQHFTALKQQLGPADDRQFAPIAGNMATLEMVMSYGRLFGGLCDTTPSNASPLPAPPAPGASPAPVAPPAPTAPPTPEVVPAPAVRGASGVPAVPAVLAAFEDRAASDAPLEPIPATRLGPIPATGYDTPASGAGGLLSQLTGFGRLRDLLVGYVGSTGELGPLSVLNFGLPPSDPAGYSASRLGGWRREYEELTVFSFQRDVLETVVPQLRYEKAARPAQIRLKVGDLSNARIEPVVNDLAYGRTRETSVGNLRLLHALNQQLHVPTAACRDTAERLLDAKLICPLGGKYVLQEADGGPQWTATALQSIPVSSGGLIKVHAPQGYLSPPLNWFRGLDLDATMTEKTVSAHAEVIMQMPVKK